MNALSGGGKGRVNVACLWWSEWPLGPLRDMLQGITLGQAAACPRPLRGPAVPGCKVMLGHGGGLSAAYVLVPGDDTRERRGRQTEQPPPGDQVGPRVVRPDRRARKRLGGALCRPAGRGFFSQGDQVTRLGRALCGPTGRRGKGWAAHCAARPGGGFSSTANRRRAFRPGASRGVFSGFRNRAAVSGFRFHVPLFVSKVP
jgi:hypothetical protein